MKKVKDIDHKKVLHNKLWDLANKVRGKINASEFQQVFLGILFYRFISEYFVDKVEENGLKDYSNKNDDDIEVLKMKKDLPDLIGFFIKPSHLFVNLSKDVHLNENINIDINDIFNSIVSSANINDSENILEGTFPNFNNLNFLNINNNNENQLKKKNNIITKTILTVAEIDFGSKFDDHSIDTFGDAYEYLIGMYAASGGKSGGEFFTPQEVSKFLANVTLVYKNSKDIYSVYDPTCGSGSLLLKFKKILNNPYLHFSGQESNPTTFSLSKMNLIIHGVEFDKIDLKCGDTLNDPLHLEKKFDVVVSNPPYSIAWEDYNETSIRSDERFNIVPTLMPKSNSDLGFVLHSLYSLDKKGVAAIVCFPGMFYRDNESEVNIRKYLVENNFIEAIIVMPNNMFFGTSISVNIMVLNKNKQTKDILFVDASSHFYKDGKKNKMSEQNIENVLKIVKDRKDIENVSKPVANEFFLDKSVNLSPDRFFKKEEVKEEIDIINLNKQLNEITSKNQKLREQIKKLIFELEGK
ncbi:type I restriction-modification system subunit M [Mycoplasma crocodyli]|uniref:site-specific DNA-methyltransferase (adenine-specific) n=1 Tax=Mycoplasma crocodyli (strain ATCC 51981 / MP145) TaxID=512564 RepID=D5E6B0_MYCCM|nr:type I restriction-modification system subunit M [Mycoplasma crocodyli]ADE19710.1 type I restriction-modification system, methyltransferase [Mycoplasma crocodyli MP145]